MSCVIQKGRVDPLHTEPLLRAGTPGSTDSRPSQAAGEAGRPQGSSHPDVQPAFL